MVVDDEVGGPVGPRPVRPEELLQVRDRACLGGTNPGTLVASDARHRARTIRIAAAWRSMKALRIPTALRSTARRRRAPRHSHGRHTRVDARDRRSATGAAGDPLRPPGSDAQRSGSSRSSAPNTSSFVSSGATIAVEPSARSYSPMMPALGSGEAGGAVVERDDLHGPRRPRRSRSARRSCSSRRRRRRSAAGTRCPLRGGLRRSPRAALR